MLSGMLSRKKMMHHLAFCIVLMLAMALLAGAESEQPSIEQRQEEKVKYTHRMDSLNILMFLSLLILTTVTIWLFKHRRFRFVHETGLGIIYGLVIGAIIRYAGPAQQQSYAIVEPVPPDLNHTYYNEPPDLLKLQTSNGPNSSMKYYEYSFKKRIPGFVNIGENKELSEKATFDPEVFFQVLLPPIIFHAGYSMKRRHFFKNFGAVVTYAFMGTAISTFAVGAILFGFTRMMPYLEMQFTDCLFFGSIISATDPVTVLAIFHDLHVDVDLYAMVFGESVLNDAVAIVLSESVEKYKQLSGSGAFDGMAILRSMGDFVGKFAGAFALGSAMGCATAVLTKYTRIRDYPLLETSLFFLMSYSTFLAAEAADLTGIVAVLFCGICQAHYTYNNLSIESKTRTKQLFDLLNFLAENFVFTYIGISTFTFQKHNWNAPFIFASFLAILIGRLCNIYPLSFLLNLGRSNKIRYNFQHMMMFSGLRGAIAFALAIRNTSSSQRQLMFSTTLLIVIATVILCGGFTTQMLQWLKIRVGVEDEVEMQTFEAVRSAMSRQRRYQTMEDGTQHPVSPSQPLPPEVPSQHYEKAWLINKWSNFDNVLIKPLLTHARPPLTETCPHCCLPLARLLTTDEQLTQSDSRVASESDTDLIIDEQQLSYGDPHNNGIAVGPERMENHKQSPTTISAQINQGPIQLNVNVDPNDVRISNTSQTRVRIPGPPGNRV